MIDLTKYNASTKQAGPLNVTRRRTPRSRNQISNSLRAVRNSDFGDYKTLSTSACNSRKMALEGHDTALKQCSWPIRPRLATFFGCPLQRSDAQGFACALTNVTSAIAGHERHPADAHRRPDFPVTRLFAEAGKPMKTRAFGDRAAAIDQSIMPRSRCASCRRSRAQVMR